MLSVKKDRKVRPLIKNSFNLAVFLLHFLAINDIFISGPFKDCQHAKEAGHSISGIYMIKPENSNGPLQLWCENSLDPGGWTVIQKRIDGSVNFFRNWDNYKVKQRFRSGGEVEQKQLLQG